MFRRLKTLLLRPMYFLIYIFQYDILLATGKCDQCEVKNLDCKTKI